MDDDSDSYSEHLANERSPLLFCSDDENDLAACSNGVIEASSPPPLQPVSESLNEKQTAVQLADTRETARLNRLQKLLQGVPPPPSFTIPQFDCSEFLARWNKNKSNLEEAVEESKNKGVPAQNNFYSASITLEEVIKLGWPDAKNVHFYDIYYNINNASEELDRLSQKFRERYVGAETSAWCNTVSNRFPNSAKKNRRYRGLNQGSPGGRLSHLARRRQTFSSAGLQQLMNANNDSKASSSGSTSGTVSNRCGDRPALFRRSAAGLSERRCIVLDAKKTNTRRTTRGPSAKKRNGSATKVRQMPKLSPQVKPAVQATKRALFQSPEEQRRPALRPAVPSPSSKDQHENRAMRSKRALWPSSSNPEISLNENGKRVLDCGPTNVYQANKIARSDASYVRSSSLPSSLNSTSTTSSSETDKKPESTQRSENRRLSLQSSSSRVSEMSELHKRKLIWAVSQALRTEGISTKHPDFRPCATVLAQHYDQIRRDWTGPPPTSTSEHMLQVVSALVADVVKTHRNKGKSGSESSSDVWNRAGTAPTQPPVPAKELFRDATSSLNVRRSLNLSLSNHSRSAPVSEAKPPLHRRAPSARKSLTFENFEDSSSRSNKSNDAFQTKDSDDLRTNARRVSRSLFGAENESKQTSSDTQRTEDSSSSKTCDEVHKTDPSTKSSSECDESQGNSAKPLRRRLKRFQETPPAKRRVTRRSWNSRKRVVKTESSSDKVVSETTQGESPGSRHSDICDGSSKEHTNGPPCASTSDGFPPARLEGSISLIEMSSKISGHSDEHAVDCLESKVITPILEATALEVSLDARGKDEPIANGDLSFSGRIESLKPADEEKENNIGLDLGLSTSASACLLDLKEEEQEGKGRDLTHWAEMATRSIKKDKNKSNECVKHLGEKTTENCSEEQSTSAEESMYPWVGQSQFSNGDSQCPTKLYEQYKYIFDSTSQGGNS